MSVEQVAEPVVLTRVRRQRTAARQDAVRRASVVLVDAMAASFAASLLALVMDTLPLRTALLVPISWMAAAWAVGAYHNRRLKMRLVDIHRLTLTAVVLWAGAGVFAVFTPIRGGNALVLVGVPLSAAVVCIGRVALLPLTRRGGRLAAAPVILLGSLADVSRFVTMAARGGPTVAPVAAACLTDVSASEVDLDRFAAPGVDLIAGLDGIYDAVRRVGADTVVAIGDVHPETIRRLSWQLEPLAVGVAIAPLWQVAPHRANVRTLGDATLIEVSPPRYFGARLEIRGWVDRVLAAVALLLFAPVFLAIAVLIKLTSPGGPVFFRQLRTGKDGRRFTLLKFRTMVPEAEQAKAALAAANQYTDGTLFKIKDDPRITPVGRWLRRFSLDELPQLVNVVRGDMLLVGPRPTSTPPENMREDYLRRTLVKPGLTGLWQVSGRSNLPWEEAVRLDLLYVENRSVAMDLDILRRTLPAVARRNGAY
ncbi:MAG TPA: exopolysaccharide biosynthesis polyprenyl glycosylphosphotransferase [Cryptosporangiaceae bacterium]|nr:exopolysaccharide biosynthesis polyprenyl glycosylphosphotransferase [Cryptosporangiaceae bacterium]